MHGTLFRQLDRRFGEQPVCSRRDLLRGSLAAMAGLILERGASGAPSANARSVLVLGAGLGGLSAALELHKAGCNVTVVEARRRLGGRVRTIANLVQGKTVEAGGELIGKNQNAWNCLAARYKLELTELGEDPLDQQPIVLDGKRLAAREAEALWSEMRTSLMGLCVPARDIDAYAPWKSADAEALDNRSTAHWIASLTVSDLCRRALTIQLTSINGMVPAWQSFLGNLAMVKGGGLEDYWTKTDALVCRGGNQQLAEQMATELGRERIRLGVPVTAVDWTAGRAGRVTLADQTVLEADTIVLAVPASCWGRIQFEPALPLAAVPQMGANTKYLVSLARPIWKQSNLAPRMLTDGPISLSWHSTSTQPGDQGEVLTLYAGGATADRAQEWSDSERQEHYLEALEAVFPGTRDVFLRGQFLNWQNDAYARGSYSFPAPGQLTTVGPALEAGLPPLYFAGEHCCPAFIGYMEGALQSGLRLAKKLTAQG